MKGLNKLALAAAISAAPFAQAELTAMDDATLDEMTGQAGVTIDVDLQMTIGQIKYVDEDGYNGGTKGAITAYNIKVGELDALGNLTGTANAKITIDADADKGMVIGLNEIGGANTGIDVQVDAVMFNSGAYEGDDAIANGGPDLSGNIGGIRIDNFRNYLEQTTTDTYNDVFDLAVTTGDSYIQGYVAISGTGSANPFDPSATTSGISIEAGIGGLMDVKWVDTDAAGYFGVKDLAFFNAVDNDSNGTHETIEALVASVDIDIEDRNGVAALKLSNMNVQGTIMMGKIVIGSATGGESNLGSVLVKDIDMGNTEVFIYGH